MRVDGPVLDFYFYGSKGFIYVINSKFCNNLAYSSRAKGGAIDGWGEAGQSLLYTENCRFINTAAGNTGGVIFLVMAHYVDNRSIFFNSYAGEEWGVIYVIK